MRFYCGKGIIAYIVLDTAGVLRRRFFVHAYVDEQLT